MLIVKLTVDEVTADGIELDLESTLTVTTRDVFADGVEVLCADVLRHLGAGPAEPGVLVDDAATTAVDVATAGGPLDTLTPRELGRLRMTVENEDIRDRRRRFDPIASADDLAMVLPILRKLLAAHPS
ncbi:hypothetical protein [Kineococcus radiotolerans]|uniref:Uncharacterized protein n=1 Tax=Kineococcus radiotolerans (strain ATCC BAA-149 / DSM 14245 / SRS30216) TaxID=266940 RepID=A6WG92_KINRD|nr:hypothetical protein [Kineococcus radiotolerans]ABS05831.1 hypothetical protein Krad_4368 [Kineococcus radiotolerans SRS30216 = ATCC BAA-149]